MSLPTAIGKVCRCKCTVDQIQEVRNRCFFNLMDWSCSSVLQETDKGRNLGS